MCQRKRLHIVHRYENGTYVHEFETYRNVMRKVTSDGYCHLPNKTEISEGMKFSLTNRQTIRS